MPTPLPPSLRATVEAQAGAVLLDQVIAAGLTRERVRARVLSGRWFRRYPRVYVTYDGPTQRSTQQWAAVLFAGLEAVLSHRSAAELWGLLDALDPDEPIDVTVPSGRRVIQQRGLRVHRSRRILALRHPSRMPPRTRVEETILDLASGADRLADVVCLVTCACQRRRTTPARLLAALAGRPTLRWRAQLRALLSDVEEGAQSPLEVAYLRSVERPHRLPRSVRQTSRRTAAGRQWSDVCYEKYLLLVELDGRLGHVEEGAFRDRRRDNGAAEDGTGH
ncbi:Transcriptional regulator, AbiEi antitoxin, Type IV TA system [Actinopolymorpha singaporensis]|uniref:Transcriptional regulator, AbiEi antitoxin, Type IV TA system n=1 Tax=Actinopolymorpha singaporensis TaxID=117157 RepID=A0A1H1WJC0_9ACTN|nr:Transcriptional regulator, AbiEi antitoxin, Type IV TA system [Actinopolymorpha singaporensis]